MHTSNGTKIIVVGVDGSSASDAALRYALHEAIATGARVCAVTAWWVGPALSDVHDELYDDRREHARTVQASAIDSVVRSIDHPPEIDRRVLHGSPTAMLLEASRGAQCLVVGSEHKGNLQAHHRGVGERRLRASLDGPTDHRAVVGR